MQTSTSTSPQQDQQSVYDRLSKPELIGIQKYNDSIIRCVSYHILLAWV
jgi:hypothetical protein